MIVLHNNLLHSQRQFEIITCLSTPSPHKKNIPEVCKQKLISPERMEIAENVYHIYPL